MDLGLNGKIALVCAASQGLGRAVAAELAAEGASLILCSRRQEWLDAACDSIGQESGVPVLGVVGNLSVFADVEAVVKAGLERFGQIDILVTNIGGPPAAAVDGLGPQGWVDATRRLPINVLHLSMPV